MNKYKIFSCISLMLLLNSPLIGSQDSFKLGNLDLNKSSLENLPKSSTFDSKTPESPHKQEQNSNNVWWLLPAGIAAVSATTALYYYVILLVINTTSCCSKMQP